MKKMNFIVFFIRVGFSNYRSYICGIIIKLTNSRLMEENDEMLIKFIKHIATPEEIKEVSIWLHKSKENESYFHALQATWAASEIISAMRNSKPDKKAIQIFLKPIQKRNKKKQIILSTLFITSVAASILLLFLLDLKRGETFDSKIILSSIESEQILLQSSSGEVYILNDSATDINYNTLGDAYINTDTIKNKTQEKKQTILNTLWIPYAKRSKIQLADGTVVHLNSGTTLIYPSTFENESKREVYLEGEAYFEVAKDQKRKFIVQTKNRKIEVLGTKFNVLADSQAEFFETVLAEGRIELNSNTGKITLIPAQLYSVKNNIETIKNVDPRNYIAWIDGVLKFENHSLSEIIIQIERIYNVEIKFTTLQYQNRKITGSLNIKSTANETLKILMQTFLDEELEIDNQFNIIQK